MTTINDVATKAGVSIKTVSRVMNGYVHVSEKTRVKVEDAISALNYAPSIIARQMRLGDDQSIGMLYGEPSSGYQTQLNHSMLKACSQAGRYLAVELFDEHSDLWVQQVADFLDRTHVSNMVLVPPMCDSVEIHDLLRKRGVKFVLLSPSWPVRGASAVAMDDRAAAKEVTDHLIGLGHARIGHIAGHEEHIVTLLRRQGYEDAIAAAGLRAECQGLVRNGKFSFKRALACAEDLLSLPDRPTAIFTANDHMAVAVLMTAHRMGLSVPEDVSVAGFDNTEMGQSIWPPLTTVAQPFDVLAASAVRLLSAEKPFEAGLSAMHILPHTFIARQSTSHPNESIG